MSVSAVLRVVPFGLAVALSAAVLFTPSPDVPPGPWWADDVVHLALFALLTATGLMLVPRLRLVAALAGYAVASEVVQAVAPLGRSGTPADVAADLVGVGLGLLAVSAARWAGRDTRRAVHVDGRAGPGAEPVDPAAELRALAAGLSADAPYRPPLPAERRRVVAAIRAVLDGGPGLPESGLPESGPGPHGSDHSDHVDPETGRPYTAIRTDGGRGMLLVDRTPVPGGLLVEVPHPGSDLRTEVLGLALFRAVPGSVLLVAGAHRRAADGAADVAHRRDSLFHALAVDLGRRGLIEVQLHGYHDDSLPGHDAVLSPGAGAAGPAARSAADALSDAGLDVCRSWVSRCGQLAGTTNEQGRAAARDDRPFLHVELSRSVREDPGRRADVIAALATALGAGS